MSAVSSTSELTTKEIVEQAISDYHNAILPFLSRGNNGYSETPIGAMQMFDDDTAPSGWLVADGTVYDIDDYPFLASHFERVHGSKNYYGGNGTTTFAVPDWQGEFFRAAGPNAHPNQGDGAAVGVHQDGTKHVNIGYSYGNYLEIYTKTTEANYWVTDADLYSNHSGSGYNKRKISMGTDHTSGGNLFYNSRPTNTSLLCCIKAVPAGINYSLEEQEVGTWMGKPLYQKTVLCTTAASITDKQGSINSTNHNISNIDYIVDTHLHYDTEALIWGTDRYYLSAQSSSTSITLNCNRSSFANTNFYVTIQYTKTTD